MKNIKYTLKDTTNAVTMPYNEENLAIAEKEAQDGVYTVEDDGIVPDATPTTKDRLEALEMAMLEMLGVTSND